MKLMDEITTASLDLYKAAADTLIQRTAVYTERNQGYSGQPRF